MRTSVYEEMTARMKKLFENLCMDDLQENHKEIAETIGFDNLLKLMDCFGGNAVYIPQKYELCRLKMYSEIIEQYDGSNIKKLATDYGISQKTVYTILKTRRQKDSKKK